MEGQERLRKRRGRCIGSAQWRVTEPKRREASRGGDVHWYRIPWALDVGGRHR